LIVRGALLAMVGGVGASGPAVAAAPHVQVLGIAQDAGHPQAGCYRPCCKSAWDDPGLGHRIASLAIVDPDAQQRWLIDASPDFPAQLRELDRSQDAATSAGLDGILLTHGHIGHYTGLMHLGREAMGAKRVPVYAMPRMQAFLEQSGPWELLTRLQNVTIETLTADEPVALNHRIRVRPIAIPHRGEYTETVGFIVTGPERSVLYLPDIDKWDRWNTRIEDVLATVDRAYVDGTFFADGEIPGRSMADIPHPFVVESLSRFAALPDSERNKIHFTHLNHTNPLLQPDSPAGQRVTEAGMHVAIEGDRFAL
jgi:pyrroloquinoline quinone biosynthesis protein B